MGLLILAIHTLYHTHYTTHTLHPTHTTHKYLPLKEILKPNTVQMPTDMVRELMMVRTAVNPRPNLDFTCSILPTTINALIECTFQLPNIPTEKVIYANTIK